MVAVTFSSSFRVILRVYHNCATAYNDLHVAFELAFVSENLNK